MKITDKNTEEGVELRDIQQGEVFYCDLVDVVGYFIRGPIREDGFVEVTYLSTGKHSTFTAHTDVKPCDSELIVKLRNR